MRRQEGAGGALIAVILAFVALFILAVVSVTRGKTGIEEREQGTAKMTAAAAALEAYASASLRLPCPADPRLDTGLEETSGAAGCQYPTAVVGGSLPWKTIGLRREDSFDAWGRKISYRVYAGNIGLTQPGGASMANCDTREAFPGGTTAKGLCRPDPNTAMAADRTTTPAQFLAGKGLTVSDFGVVHSDVAYVLISHGLTGLGGYSASGRLAAPTNAAERDNSGNGPTYTIQAFSNPDTSANAALHFDDLLVYRGIEELAKRANLAARNWPDTILSSVVFDRATVRAALGGTNPGSDTGTDTINFNNATVRAFDSAGSQDISFLSGGTESIGGVSGGDGLLASGGAEGVQIDFAEDARQFAFTLDKFDDSGLLHERAELRFLEVAGNTATLKGTVVKQSCASNGKVASFSVDICASFNRVEIRPVTMSDNISPSSFSLAEIRSCAQSVTCETTLQPSGNVCSTKSFVPCSIGTNDASLLTITLSNPTNTNMTGADFTDSYPAGLVNTASAAASTTCAGGVVTAASGGNSVALSGGTVPAKGLCTVKVDVTAAAAGAYVNTTSDVSTASAGTIAAVSGTLKALVHPAVAMAFAPASVVANAPSTLTITLSNANTTPISDVALTDTLPPGLIATIASAATTCGGNVAVTNSGTTFALSGGTIPGATIPSGSCGVTLEVTSTSTGTYVNTLAAGAVASGNAGTNAVAASASLAVN